MNHSHVETAPVNREFIENLMAVFMAICRAQGRKEKVQREGITSFFVIDQFLIELF